MRSSGLWAAAVAAIVLGCGPAEGPRDGHPAVAREGLVAQATQAAVVGMTNALSTPAQRHVVRLEPPGHAPVYLMAVQNSGYTDQRPGLLWYRSDDGGATWRYYRDIVARPDPAVYDSSRSPSTLHLTADLLVVGDDIAAVYSYDTTGSDFPADAWDPRRVVHFQWWRFDGVDDWDPGSRRTVAAPGKGQAYRRAELARDGLGRLWVQSFLRRSSCSPVGGSACVGDVIQVWVSTDDGESFQGPQTLAELPRQMGGGRLFAVGSRLFMLWADHSSTPAQLMRRDDDAPLTQWSPKANAFADGVKIYHGAALSAAPDGAGGLHLVYKRWVASPDVHQLYYRHFDGDTFGPARELGGAGDWATQPAITTTEDDLHVCVNHVVSTNQDYEMRSYRLSDGFASFDVLDARAHAKAYPAAPVHVPSSDGAIPCAFGMGDGTTRWWGAGHTVQVALQAVPAGSPSAAAPAFSPAPGTYPSAQAVSLSSATEGASIFYTTDGSTPTTASTPYDGPIPVSATTTVRAIATASGFATSPVASGTFTIQPPPVPAAAAPAFSPAPGTYPSAQAVSLSSATEGASIFYTTDGSTPTTASTPYDGPIPVSATTTVRAIATAPGFATSPVASGTFTIQPPAPAALFADDFARTTGLGSSWRTWHGSFRTDGARAISGSTDENWASVVAPLGTSDYAVEAAFSIPSGALYSGVVARSSGGSSFTRDLYAAQLSAKGSVNLYRRNGWSWTLLRSVSAGVQTGRLHALRLVTTGTSPVHLEVWLDGARLVSYDDASSSRIASGAVGMVNYDAGVQYESFRVVAR